MEKLDPHMQRAFCLGRLTKKSRVTFPPSHMSHSVANPALRSVWPRLTWRVFLYGCVIVFMFVLSHRVGLMRRCYEGQTLLTFEVHRAEADWLTEGGLWDDWTRLMTTEMSFKVRESRSDVNNRPETPKTNTALPYELFHRFNSKQYQDPVFRGMNSFLFLFPAVRSV